MSKFIEERANEYIGHPYEIDEGSSISGMRNAFCMGAASEHEELTHWHNPEVELPEKGKNVIVKYVSKDDESSPYYTIGRVYGDNKWDCESLLVAYDNFKIIGWREIFE